jgi:hypothetical protein
MLVSEAKWIRRQIERIDPAQLFPILNVGSQTKQFRQADQPWMDDIVFGPLCDRGLVVKHLDLRAGDGVDLVGDICEPAFLAEVKRLGFRSVLCNSLLEHVTDRELMIERLLDVVPRYGFLIVTVPFKHPYHPDPIDTMFRPSPDELAALFPNTTLIEKTIAKGTLAAYVSRKLVRSRGATVRRVLAAPLQDQRSAQHEGRMRLLLPWLFRPFEVAGVVLQKTG